MTDDIQVGAWATWQFREPSSRYSASRVPRARQPISPEARTFQWMSLYYYIN